MWIAYRWLPSAEKNHLKNSQWPPQTWKKHKIWALNYVPRSKSNDANCYVVRTDDFVAMCLRWQLRRWSGGKDDGGAVRIIASEVPCARCSTSVRRHLFTWPGNRVQSSCGQSLLRRQTLWLSCDVERIRLINKKACIFMPKIGTYTNL